MTGLDELFKKPSAPGQKRKLEATRDPNEIYKSIKSNGKAAVRGVTIENEPEAPEGDEEAGPELPADFDDGADDEEGRFFGGGITRDTADVLDFIEERDGDDGGSVEKIDSAWLRKTALNFEKKISKNAELRAKYESEPQKFMGSEADLDADIKALSILSEHPELYEEFAKLGCVGSLVSLLSHENTDIAIDAIEIMGELLDQDSGAEEEQWNALADAMLEVDVLDLLYQNTTRLNEELDSDASGVYHILEVLESLASRSSISDAIAAHKDFIPWLVSRARRKGKKDLDQNTQYSAELLHILLQSSKECQKRFVQAEGVDYFLQILAAYRRRDPEKGTEEEEFVENVFDCVTCIVDGREGKEKFLEAEGVELCLIMVKEGKMSRPRALRLLDHALGGNSGVGLCERFVEAAGLKPLFSLFMKKQDSSTTEHIYGIMMSLLSYLPADSAPRIRLLAKFVEKDYAKIARLIAIRRDVSTKVAGVDKDWTAEAREEEPDMYLSARFEAGLFVLEVGDVILAWLVAEDDGAREKIVESMKEKGEGLDDIKKVLEGQLGDARVDGKENDEESGGFGEMVKGLIDIL